MHNISLSAPPDAGLGSKCQGLDADDEASANLLTVLIWEMVEKSVSMQSTCVESDSILLEQQQSGFEKVSLHKPDSFAYF